MNCLAACVIESNDAFGEEGAMACAGEQMLMGSRVDHRAVKGSGEHDRNA